MSAVQGLIVENKLASIGVLVVLAAGASLVCNRKKRSRNYVRMHIKAVTIAMVSGAALLLCNTNRATADVGEVYENAPEALDEWDLAAKDERWSW
ncbi:hypothetical protein FCM35_KLT07522 [Carex littledalei]|uniref:HIG1 domain-containing protein n=1 Tax=Carex littledalei TaxID=544730 RepID=A0A833VL35_9POAL|nr:hypothetical protein FCM35_KLT07522 [Carex littledalei]